MTKHPMLVTIRDNHRLENVRVPTPKIQLQDNKTLPTDLHKYNPMAE